MSSAVRRASFLLGGMVVVAAPATAGEYHSQFVTNATRCSAYGPDFAAVEGSDVCARIGGHVRVQLGTNAGLRSRTGWSAGQAASATLKSDGAAPASGPTPTHLRVQGGLAFPNPFR